MLWFRLHRVRAEVRATLRLGSANPTKELQPEKKFSLRVSCNNVPCEVLQHVLGFPAVAETFGDFTFKTVK